MSETPGEADKDDFRSGIAGIARCARFDNNLDKAAECYIKAGDLDGTINVAYDYVLNDNMEKAKEVLEKAGFEVGNGLYGITGLLGGNPTYCFLDVLSDNKCYEGIVMIVDKLLDYYKSDCSILDTFDIPAIIKTKIKDKKLRNETLEKLGDFFFDEQDHRYAYKCYKSIDDERKRWDLISRHVGKFYWWHHIITKTDTNTETDCPVEDNALFEAGEAYFNDRKGFTLTNLVLASESYGAMSNSKLRDDSLFKVAEKYLSEYETFSDSTVISCIFGMMSKEDSRRDEGLLKVGDAKLQGDSPEDLFYALRPYAKINNNSLRIKALRKFVNRALLDHDFEIASRAADLLGENISVNDLEQAIEHSMTEGINEKNAEQLTKICLTANYEKGLNKIMKHYSKKDNTEKMQDICSKTNSNRHWLMLGNYHLNRFDFKNTGESYKMIIQNFQNSAFYNDVTKWLEDVTREPEHTADVYMYCGMFPDTSEIRKNLSKARDEIKYVGKIRKALREGDDEAVRENIKNLDTFLALHITCRLCRSYDRPDLGMDAIDRIDSKWDFGPDD